MRRRNSRIVLSVLFLLFLIYFSLYLRKKFSPIKCDGLKKSRKLPRKSIHWESLNTDDGRVNILNAYVETRLNGSVVLINSNGPSLQNSYQNIYCQFFYEKRDENPFVVKVSGFRMLWGGELPGKLIWFIIFKLLIFVLSEKVRTNRKISVPFFLVCPLSKDRKIPSSVSLVTSACGKATNNRPIVNRHPTHGVKKEFGVCTGQMKNSKRDFVPRFIEWILLLELLGAEKIHGYVQQLPAQIYPAMKYFLSQSLVEFLSFGTPKYVGYKDKEWSLKTFEQNFLNDCFHKLKNFVKFIVVLDVDEMILPLKETDMNWHDMMKNFNVVDKDFFYYSYVNFRDTSLNNFTDINNYYYMLNRIEVRWK